MKSTNRAARHRPPEQIALNFVAAFAAQAGKLILGFDAFGDDGDVETVAKHDDRAHDRVVVRIFRHVADETLVDLEPADGKLLT